MKNIRLIKKEKNRRPLSPRENIDSWNALIPNLPDFMVTNEDVKSYGGVAYCVAMYSDLRLEIFQNYYDRETANNMETPGMKRLFRDRETLVLFAYSKDKVSTLMAIYLILSKDKGQLESVICFDFVNKIYFAPPDSTELMDWMERTIANNIGE